MPLLVWSGLGVGGRLAVHTTQLFYSLKKVEIGERKKKEFWILGFPKSFTINGTLNTFKHLKLGENARRKANFSSSYLNNGKNYKDKPRNEKERRHHGQLSVYKKLYHKIFSSWWLGFNFVILFYLMPAALLDDIVSLTRGDVFFCIVF